VDESLTFMMAGHAILDLRFTIKRSISLDYFNDSEEFRDLFENTFGPNQERSEKTSDI